MFGLNHPQSELRSGRSLPAAKGDLAHRGQGRPHLPARLSGSKQANLGPQNIRDEPVLRSWTRCDWQCAAMLTTKQGGPHWSRVVRDALLRRTRW